MRIIFFIGYPSFFEIYVYEEIKGQHRVIVKEILKRNGEEPSVPKTIATPYGRWIIQNDRNGGQEIIENDEGNHRNPDVEPVVPGLQDVWGTPKCY